MDPIKSVGLVFLDQDGGIPTFLGTCFSFRQPSHVLTAAHVTSDHDPSKLSVLSPRDDWPFSRVSEVVEHPTADLAVVKLKGKGLRSTEPFMGVAPSTNSGDVYRAIGFFEEFRNPRGAQPTERMLTGHVQRQFTHKSHLGYTYAAIELSTPCPAGLSGGPVYGPNKEAMITGVAAESIESTSATGEEVVEIQGDQTVITRYRTIVSYGIATLLHPLVEWLDKEVPK